MHVSMAPDMWEWLLAKEVGSGQISVDLHLLDGTLWPSALSTLPTTNKKKSQRQFKRGKRVEVTSICVTYT